MVTIFIAMFKAVPIFIAIFKDVPIFIAMFKDVTMIIAMFRDNAIWNYCNVLQYIAIAIYFSLTLGTPCVPIFDTCCFQITT